MKPVQVSDSFFCGVLLAVSGGSMDAYSYLFGEKVFANAQTGNMLLLGVNLVEHNYYHAIKYLLPILFFTVGIILSDYIRYIKIGTNIHWRQIVVGIEALILFCVAFIPQSFNTFANVLTSLVCGMQVEAFRKINGNSAATTMCIGNLRSGTENLYSYFRTKNRRHIKTAALYYGIITSFIIGAIAESILLKHIGSYAIMFSTIILLITLIYMKKT